MSNVNVSLAKVARLLREAREELQASNDAIDINHRVEFDVRTSAEKAYDEHLANGISTAKQVLLDAGLDPRLLFD